MNRTMDLPGWADCWVASDFELIPANCLYDVTGYPIYYDVNGNAIDMTGREVYEPQLDHDYGAVLIVIFIVMMAGCMIFVGW